ncbi:BglG family transcription antiterminator [Enterococcus casseliflavus]
MLSKKEIIMLKMLYQNRNTYTSSKQIAKQLGVSDRTARKYVQGLGLILKNHKLGQICAKQGQGYRLNITDQRSFDRFYTEKTNTRPTAADLTTINEANDRQYFVLNQLLFGQKPVFVDDLAADLCVSRSTISNDIVEIKQLLKPYTIELKHRTSQGIYVAGSENSLRHFIMNYFFMNRLQDNLYAFSMYKHLLEGIAIEEIVIIVLDTCRKYFLKLSDFMIYTIVLHIGLAIKRLQAGFEIQLHLQEANLAQEVEYQSALEIVEKIRQQMGIVLPPEEAFYIAIHLKNKLVSETIREQIDLDDNEVKQQLLVVLQKIDQETGFCLAEDPLLIDGLMMHITPLLQRLNNGTSMENPLLETIKKDYSDFFQLTIRHFSDVPFFAPYKVTEGELAYLTIHLTAAMERLANQQKARVLVICATGIGSSQMLKNRLEHELGSKLVIEEMISYYEISEQKLAGIDLIISSIKVPDVVLNIPIVTVSVFLDKKDIQKINRQLKQYKTKKQYRSVLKQRPKTLSDKERELIETSFRPELFLWLAEETDKEAVLDQLLTRIESVEKRAVKEALGKQLALREAYSSVAFSDHLAVAHPIEPITNDAYAAVAILKQGIKWDDEHDQIQLIFLLSPDRLGQVELNKISQLLVPIIEDESFKDALIASGDFEHFMECFIGYHLGTHLSHM